MKAIRIREHGDARVLHLEEELARPQPGDGEVLVRVAAASVNPLDVKVRSGHLKDMVALQLPWTPGCDFAGRVEKLGLGVTDVSVGDQVFGKVDLPRDGSYAEYVVVPRAGFGARPRTLDDVHAAAVPLAALTAWQALFGLHQAPSLEHGPSLDLADGQRLLILGAAGGVGSFAVQFAKVRGARVAALVRPGQEAYARELGADDAVTELEQAPEVDAVLDLVGGELQQRAWRKLAGDGKLASTLGGERAIAIMTRTNPVQLERIAGLIDDGKVKVVVSKTFPLAEARAAHEMLEGHGTRGKIVLTVAR